MFIVGDRVRFAARLVAGDRDPVGTVTGFVSPDFAALLDAPDDVRVHWDSGLELLHAPAELAHAAG